MNDFLRSLSAAVFCCVVAGCGIFTPRDDFETPEVTTSVGDPFHFADLLKGSGEQFSKLDWNDLFDEEFKYTNIRLADIVYDKQALINRLELQHEIFPGVVVNWKNEESPLINVDMITLNVSYSIATTESPETPLFSGNSGFVIVRGSDNIWRIRSWTDEPNGEPFFSSAPE